jgi:cob(I)alamin adenosyltransferase
MVRLDRIYTKSGDDGTTSLGDGTRVPKHDLRVVAYGTTDELSSVLGLALANGMPEPLVPMLLAIQNDLFDVGADLCVPGTEESDREGDKPRRRLRVTPEYTQRLEQWIDRENEPLAPLQSFILPGGAPASAWLHLARNVCRRAERFVTELAARPEEHGRVNAEVTRYLNRLSDLLFVLARAVNARFAGDVLWKPGLGHGA